MDHSQRKKPERPPASGDVKNPDNPACPPLEGPKSFRELTDIPTYGFYILSYKGGV